MRSPARAEGDAGRWACDSKPIASYSRYTIAYSEIERTCEVSVTKGDLCDWLSAARGGKALGVLWGVLRCSAQLEGASREPREAGEEGAAGGAEGEGGAAAAGDAPEGGEGGEEGGEEAAAAGADRGARPHEG